jgi:DNA-directed RNA polymerase subunit L
MPSRFVSHIKTDSSDYFLFTLSQVNVSFANAIRRTILADIQTVIFKDVDIKANTSRFNNELIKHRLGCIPIFITTLEQEYLDTFTVKVNVENTTDMLSYVTTKDFEIEPATLNRDEVFPVNELSNQYIDVLRLQANEKIQFTSKLTTGCAKQNSCYNVVSTCTYILSHDTKKIEEIRKDTKWTSELDEKNFMALNAHRICKLNSFDFRIKSIGVFASPKIVETALLNLIQRLKELQYEIHSSASTFQICLKGEDYTIGKMLEYCFYNSLFENSMQLYFCSFIKSHPHDVDSFIKLSYKTPKTMSDVKTDLTKCINDCIEVLEEIKKAF